MRARARFHADEASYQLLKNGSSRARIRGRRSATYLLRQLPCTCKTDSAMSNGRNLSQGSQPQTACLGGESRSQDQKRISERGLLIV